MGRTRAETTSGLLTRFGDCHRVFRSFQHDEHGIATACKRTK